MATAASSADRAPLIQMQAIKEADAVKFLRTHSLILTDENPLFGFEFLRFMVSSMKKKMSKEWIIGIVQTAIGMSANNRVLSSVANSLGELYDILNGLLYPVEPPMSQLSCHLAYDSSIKTEPKVHPASISHVGERLYIKHSSTIGNGNPFGLFHDIFLEVLYGPWNKVHYRILQSYLLQESMSRFYPNEIHPHRVFYIKLAPSIFDALLCAHENAKYPDSKSPFCCWC